MNNHLLSLTVCLGMLLGAGTPKLRAGEGEEKIVTEVPVHVGTVIRTNLHRYVLGYGVVEPEPASATKPAAGTRLASPIPGVVAAADCFEGQRVDKGAVLFRLDTRLADVGMARAQAAVDFAENNLARQKKLLAVEGTSQKLLQESEQQAEAARNELASAQAQRALLNVVAPLAGTLVRVNVRVGEAVDLTTVLAELIDLDRLVVTANVPSPELAPLALGQPVAISTSQSSRENSLVLTNALLTFIGSQVDPKTDTATVRISIPAGAGLRPGQFVQVRIASEERRDRLAVPVASIIKAEESSILAIVEGDKTTQKPVEIGLREGGWVEVKGEDLKEGMKVVTEGAYGLPKETKIRLVP